MNTAQDLPRHESQLPQKVERQRQRPYAAPRVDVHETKDAYQVVADVPGVSENDLSITVERDTLTIEAAVEPAKREHRLRLAESVGGGFLRSFALPDGIDRERISATVRNGVLRLTLPKSEAMRPRRIVVQPGA
jgi:HSP20 family molecular chaperone IbpA